MDGDANSNSVSAFGLLLTQCLTLMVTIKQTSSVNRPLQLVNTEILKTSGIILMLTSIGNSFLDSSNVLFLQKGQQNYLFLLSDNLEWWQWVTSKSRRNLRTFCICAVSQVPGHGPYSSVSLSQPRYCVFERDPKNMYPKDLPCLCVPLRNYLLK